MSKCFDIIIMFICIVGSVMLDMGILNIHLIKRAIQK